MRLGPKSLGLARAAALLFATAGLTAVAVAAVAMAGSASKRITIPAQSRGRATAPCERGQTAVAGGFAAPGFSPLDDGPSAVRLVSKPATRRKITTNAYNFGRQPAELVTFAYCARKRRGLEVRSKKAFIGAQDPGSAVARCRRGTKVVGGGFGTQGFSKRAGPRVLTLTSRRIGSRQWRVEAMNMGGDGSSTGARPGTLIAYAYCQKDPPKLVSASKRVEVPVAEVTTAKVRCPRGTTAYSGGFDGNLKLTADPSASGAVTSKRADRARAWELEALNVSDTSPAHVTAFAYCRN